MPQSWETAKGWEIDPKDYKKKSDRKDYLQSIGNLTLLNCKANAELAKDHAFSRKKQVYGKYATLKITDDIKDSPNWDVDEICKRAKKMYRLFCRVWPSAQSFERQLAKRRGSTKV